MKTFAKTILLAVATSQIVTEAAGADHCRALALSGGGSNGAWEAGVIWGLMHYGDPDDFDWDVITGISAGSINTLAIAGWDYGTGKEMSEWLSDLWQNLKTSDVWKNWKIGLP
jgi:predicted acylesterase/phospholipase RssA